MAQSVLRGGRAHALYSPCRPVPVKKRFLQSLSAGRRTRMRIQPDYDWADGQRRLSQKKTGRQDSGMQRLHCSLLPMKALTYKGTGRQARFPNRKELSFRGMVRVCGSDGPFPGGNSPEKPPWRHRVRGAKKHLWSSCCLFVPVPQPVILSANRLQEAA